MNHGQGLGVQWRGWPDTPAGVFSRRAAAEEWIRRHKLTGMLTAYPMDTGLYDWAVEQEVFKPKRDEQRTAWFIGRFTSASLEHYHYEDGKHGSGSIHPQ